MDASPAAARRRSRHPDGDPSRPDGRSCERRQGAARRTHVARRAWRPSWRTPSSGRPASTRCRSRFTMQGDWVLLVSAALRRGARVERRIDVANVRPVAGDTAMPRARSPRFPVTPMSSAGRLSAALLRWRRLRTATQLVLLLVAIVDRRARARRSAAGAEEPRHGSDVDPLSGPAHRRAAGGRQRVLRRLSDDPGARPRPPVAPAHRGIGRGGSGRSGWRSVLFVGVLFIYELFDLWALPAATAWLVVGYFAAALARRY